MGQLTFQVFWFQGPPNRQANEVFLNEGIRGLKDVVAHGLNPTSVGTWRV
jgi:hypothetical protein